MMVAALLLREPHLSRMLDGTKTWEIRGSRTHYRGRLILARSGSGLLIGECRLIDVAGPLDLDTLIHADALPVEQRQGIGQEGRVPYVRPDGTSRTYAWIVGDPVTYPRPIPYHHPQGAVIFVNLSPAVSPDWFAAFGNT